MSIAEVIQAIKAYYSTIEGFVTSNPLLLNLKHMAGHITREYDMYIFHSGGILVWKNMDACGDTLMNGYWEELLGKLEKLLHATNYLYTYCMFIQAIIKYSSGG